MYLWQKTVLVLLVVARPGVALASSDCAVRLGSQKASIETLIANLAELREDLDVAYASGGPALLLGALERDFNQKLDEVVSYAEGQSVLTRGEVVARLKDYIGGRHRQQIPEADEAEITASQKSQLDFRIDGKKGIFFPLEPKGTTGIDPLPEAPFNFMATPVTQTIFRRVEDLVKERIGEKRWAIRSFNRIFFGDLANIFRFRGPQRGIGPVTFYYQGDTRPADSVSYQNVQHWLKDLNRLSQEGEPRLAEIFPGHQKGDIYRLPSFAEWNFVAHHIGSMMWVRHGWFSTAGILDSTLAVALRPPVIVQGGEFYDVVGNVAEIVEGGEEMWGRQQVYAVGGSVVTDPIQYTLIPKHHRYPTVGFRLVRERGR